MDWRASQESQDAMRRLYKVAHGDIELVFDAMRIANIETDGKAVKEERIKQILEQLLIDRNIFTCKACDGKGIVHAK